MTSREPAADGALAARSSITPTTAGVRAQKIFSIAPDKPYVINVTASVTRERAGPSPTTLKWGPALGSGITVKSRTYNPPPQPIFFKDGKVTRIAPDKIAAQPVQDGVVRLRRRRRSLLPRRGRQAERAAAAATTRPSTCRSTDAPGRRALRRRGRRAIPSPPQGAAYFAGPKDFDVLAAVDRDLVRAIDFGMFSWLVVPLLRALKWLNVYVGNYGWSLILLTVLINLAMFPLRHKSVVSMRKMQDVQPEVKAIQDRYAKLKMSDPARGKMNTELMALYKERGVNPASGCVPMLLTLPVLFAFYSMLSVAIELRGAPFIGQIHDLSAHDPWFIWPVVMGVTMFIQQKMTPSTADPMQQKMMMFMPIMMTGMFLWAASGLVIYWTVSNVWGIGQQMITNRLIGPAVAAHGAPAGGAPDEERQERRRRQDRQAAKDKERE